MPQGPCSLIKHDKLNRKKKWNSQIFDFGHLPLPLKTPSNNTDHHLDFLQNFPIFYHNFSFRNALLSISGNVHQTLGTVPPNIIPIFFYNFFLFYCYFSFDKSHAFHIWKWAVDPENSRTLQSQKSIYKQKKMPPIVKKITCFFFLKLGPQTLLVVQENLSRTKMYSVVKP